MRIDHVRTAMAAHGQSNQTGRVHGGWNMTYSPLDLHVLTSTTIYAPDLQTNMSSSRWLTHFSGLTNIPQRWIESAQSTRQKGTSSMMGNSGGWAVPPRHMRYLGGSACPKLKQSNWPGQNMQNYTWVATLSGHSFSTKSAAPCSTHP